MYWQREKFRAAATMDVGGTYKLDLPNNGLLGGVMLHIYKGAVNDSMVAIQKWRMLDYISQIQVIGDGSTVLKKLTGQCAHYMNWLDGGGAAPDQHFNYGTSTKRFHTMINFGRRMFDPDYGLDLSRWKSVELHITNDAAAAQFSAAINVDVVLYWLRQAGAGFKGLMRTEEWRSWTTVADERKYLDLPPDRNLRRIVLQVVPAVDSTSKEADTTPYNVLDDIELYLKTGMYKVFDASLRELWYDQYFAHGRDVLQPLEPYHTSAYGIWTGLGQTLGKGGTRVAHTAAASTYGTTLKAGDDSSTLVRYESGGEQDTLLLMGLALENCAAFEFDQNPDPATWLDAKENETVQLQAHTANSSSADNGTVRVILDRLMV